MGTQPERTKYEVVVWAFDERLNCEAQVADFEGREGPDPYYIWTQGTFYDEGEAARWMFAQADECTLDDKPLEGTTLYENGKDIGGWGLQHSRPEDGPLTVERLTESIHSSERIRRLYQPKP